MPRIAIGDLTCDLDVPARFTCEYTLNGSLIAESAGTSELFELSVITIDANTAVDVVTERATKAGQPLQEKRDDFVSFFDAPKTWLAGTANRVIVATLVKGSPPEFAAMLSSVAPAHDAFPIGGALHVTDLRASHTRFFEQRRTTLLDAVSWSSQLHDAVPKLDAFWGELLDDPPEDPHLLSTMISGAAIAFGDLLCQRGFTWVIGKDDYGTSIGVVALRGTANVWVVPDDFVAKRWERGEREFVGVALEQISKHVEKMRADWKNSIS